MLRIQLTPEIKTEGSPAEEAATEEAPPEEAPAEVAPAVHPRVQCDGCGACPIVGPRFKCSVREDYDLCSACEAKDASGMALLKIKTPSEAPAAVVTVLRENQHAGTRTAGAASDGHPLVESLRSAIVGGGLPAFFADAAVGDGGLASGNLGDRGGLRCRGKAVAKEAKAAAKGKTPTQAPSTPAQVAAQVTAPVVAAATGLASGLASGLRLKAGPWKVNGQPAPLVRLECLAAVREFGPFATLRKFNGTLVLRLPGAPAAGDKPWKGGHCVRVAGKGTVDCEGAGGGWSSFLVEVKPLPDCSNKPAHTLL